MVGPQRLENRSGRAGNQRIRRTEQYVLRGREGLNRPEQMLIHEPDTAWIQLSHA